MSLPATDASNAKTGLRRDLGLWQLLVYGIILVQPTAPMPVFGVLYQETHGHVVLAILIALVAMLFTAFSYGLMAKAYPQGGSAYTYVGKELHPGLGYITGWCMAMDYVLNPLICTVWSAQAMLNFVHVIPQPAWIVFFAVLFTGINLRGIETSAKINAALTAGLGVVIVIFIVDAFRYIANGHALGASDLFAPIYNPATFSSGALFRGTSIAVLTYIGFDGVSTLTDEARKPEQTIPRAIILTCLLTGVLAVIEVYLAQLVWPRGRAFPDIDTAYVHVAGLVGGGTLFAIVNTSLLIATIGSGTASLLGASRLLLAMGQDGALPRKLFGYVDPKSRVPSKNVLLIGVIVLVGALILNYDLGAQLLNYGALIAFMGVNLAAAVLAWRSGTASKKMGAATWGSIALSVCGLAVCFFLWINLGPLARIAGSIWAVVGLALWWLRARRARKAEIE